MNLLDPKFLLPVGFFLVLFGAVAPFLIVIGILPSTYFLNFLAFSSSVIGLFLGLLGVAVYRQGNRRKD